MDIWANVGADSGLMHSNKLATLLHTERTALKYSSFIIYYFLLN